MRYFHYKKNPHHMPCVNLDKVWSMIGLEQVSPPTLPPSQLHTPRSSQQSSLAHAPLLFGPDPWRRKESRLVSRDSLRPESSACQLCENAFPGAWYG